MKRYELTINGRTFDVRLQSDPMQDQVEVEVNGEMFVVEFRALPPDTDVLEARPAPAASAPASAAAPTTSAKSTAPSGYTLTAPLPGEVKLIAVRPGQQVSIGDALLVIEAMKMENVIRATREGIVETIHVAEGRQVAHGELLLEYRQAS
jgi:biotin carboxyl carrier protein